MENTDDDHGLLHIPEDVLIQILMWLPVISLLRFKSVCKFWRALIESSSFIHLHATTSSSNKFGTFIFQASPLRDDTSHTSDATETRFFMLTPSRRRSGGGGGGEVFEVEDLWFPPLYKTDPAAWWSRWRMVGSCNGLICSKLRKVISLWNPATRQFRLLPNAPYSLTSLEGEEKERGYTSILDVFGFGFDVKTKDYKVVQIRPLFVHGGKFVEFRVQVYSLNSNSWRVFFFKDFSLFPKPFQGGSSLDMSTDGLYRNGSLFIKGTYYEDRKQRPRHWILSFDFTKEIFTPIKHFPDEQVVPSSGLLLTHFGADKIAFLVHSHSSSREGERRMDLAYDIWVLNNEEEEEEHDDDDQEKPEEESYYYWTKLQHSIRITIRGSGSIFPRAISDDGEFALIETRRFDDDDDDDDDAKAWKLQLFNIVTKEEKTAFVLPTKMGLNDKVIYKPSLVSVIGGGGGGGGGGNGIGTATATATADNNSRVVIGGAM